MQRWFGTWQILRRGKTRKNSLHLPVALGLAVVLSSCATTVVSDRHPHPATAVPFSLGAPVGEAGPASAPPLAVAICTAQNHSAVTVPILMYHYVRVDPVATDHLGFRLSVTPANFQAQMDFLSSHNATPITPNQLVAAIKNRTPLPLHPVVLTFDDGHSDFATNAVPVLLAHHFVAVSYVVTGFMGRPDYMTSTQVQQVAADGMVIGAHTVDHIALANVPVAIARSEIVTSKAILSQLLGHPITDFAYPYGSVNPAVRGLVEAAGFLDAVSTYGGDSQSSCNLFSLLREGVNGGDPLAVFGQKALLLPRPTPIRPSPSATTRQSPVAKGRPSAPARRP